MRLPVNRIPAAQDTSQRDQRDIPLLPRCEERQQFVAGLDPGSRILTAGMKDPAHPLYLSTLTVDAAAFARRHPEVAADAGRARILRSVLMKPESETYVAQLHARVEDLAC